MVGNLDQLEKVFIAAQTGVYVAQVGENFPKRDGEKGTIKSIGFWGQDRKVIAIAFTEGGKITTQNNDRLYQYNQQAFLTYNEAKNRCIKLLDNEIIQRQKAIATLEKEITVHKLQIEELERKKGKI